MNIKKLNNIISRGLLLFAGLLISLSGFLYAPSLVNAQYGGVAPAGGQILGEAAKGGIPAYYLPIAIGLIILATVVFFFIKRHRSR